MTTEAPAAAPPATDAPAPAPAHQHPQQPQLPPRSSQYVQYPGAYGQPFQAYQHYGMQPTNTPRWSTLQQQIPPGAQVIQPPPVTETKKWVMSKMVLHAFAFVFALVILGLGLTFVNDWTFGIVMLIMNCTLAGISILWSGTELIVRAVHSFKQGVHPGAHVGLTLIIWLAAAIVGGFATAITVSATMYDGYWGSYYCDTSYDSYGYATYEECDEPTGRNAILVASTIFTWFQWIIYFVLFVLACIDTSRLNAAKNRPIMVVQQQHPSAWGPEMGTVAQPPNAFHPGVVPAGVPRQSMPPQPRASVHTASGAMPPPPQTNEKGKQPEGSSSHPNIQEYYTPGTAN